MRYSLPLTLFFALSFHPNNVLAFPQYGSLAGLSARQLAEILPTLQARSDLPSPPGPLSDTSAKLVNDAKHPYIPPGPNDIRGPCPAMNTLANHGYIPRSGIARPSQIVAGLQEGLNVANDLARVQVYGNHLANGNMLTDLLSIGQKTSRTGADPPTFVVGGLDDHNTFEGDASISRTDFYFGDNHSFNETIFQQFIAASKNSSDGKFDPQVAADLRYVRYKQSIATNPTFEYGNNRYFASFNEGVFAYMLFVDGRSTAKRLDVNAARSFFQFGKMPHNFHRTGLPLTSLANAQEVFKLQKTRPDVVPGSNNGTVNSFITTPPPVGLDICGDYRAFVNIILQQHPSVTGDLRNALKTNLHYFYTGFSTCNCTEVFPYGPLS